MANGCVSIETHTGRLGAGHAGIEVVEDKEKGDGKEMAVAVATLSLGPCAGPAAVVPPSSL